MINLRKFIEDMDDRKLVAFWNSKIIFNVGCDACPIDRKYCNKQAGTCDEVFEKWSLTKVDG